MKLQEGRRNRRGIKHPAWLILPLQYLFVNYGILNTGDIQFVHGYFEFSKS